MAEQIWNRSNFFVHGEVGNRLNGIRETEVYKYSANSLTNWYITEAGNLKAAKKYRGIGLVNDEIVDVIDTKYYFFIVATTREFVSFDKVTKNPISRLVHGLPLTKTVNITILECKFRYRFWCVIFCNTINITILECKCFIFFCHHIFHCFY